MRGPAPTPVLAVILAALGPPACGGEPGAGRPPTDRTGECAGPPARPPGLVVAGSGTAVAFARAVAAGFRSAHPRGAVWVGESIGTSGAVAALLDGAVDVGLASRALRPEEERAGIEAVPWALGAFGPVVRVAVDGPAAPDRLSAAGLAAMIRGEVRTWPDGTPVVVLLREPEDSGQGLLRGWSEELDRAISEALDAGRWPVLTTDQEMRDAVLSTRGAVGFLDRGTLRLEGLPLRELADDPPRRKLSLLLGPRSPPIAREFVGYAISLAAASVRTLAGYAPPADHDPGTP